MKKLSFLLLLSFFIAACNNTGTTDQDNEEATESATPEKRSPEIAIIDISGMHSDACANTITNALKELEGVNKVKVSLEYEQAKLKFDREVIGSEEIKSAIEAIGYTVDNIEIVQVANQAEKPTE